MLFRYIVHGFTNRDLRTQLAPLLGKHPEQIKPAAASYDLRRLREHGLIARIDRSWRYQTTELGYQLALPFTYAQDHLLRTGMAELTDTGPDPPALHKAATAFRHAFTGLTQHANLAALTRRTTRTPLEQD